MQPETVSQIADHLIDNDVIVLPVKTGDWLYEIQDKEIVALRISSITIFKNSIEMCCHIEEDYCRYFIENDIGSTIFLTIDQAKKALKECNQK